MFDVDNVSEWGKLRITFFHKVPGKKKIEWEPIVAPGTLCEIREVVEDDPGDLAGSIFYGQAYLKPGDNFSRETGRKIALRRAITGKIALNKADRTRIWEAYFETQAAHRHNSENEEYAAAIKKLAEAT